MKIQIKKIVGVLLACAGIMTSTSCADFEEINKNPYLPDKDMEQKDGVLNGAYMPNLEKHIIPVPLKTDNTDLTNAYQISINLCGDSWIGYFSPRDNKWNEASNTTTFFFSEGWVNLMYEYAITNIFAPWIDPAFYPEASDYLEEYIREHKLSEYLTLIKESKKVCPIPIIASINCYTDSEWIDFAKMIEEAGADALEINILALQSEVQYTYGSFEQRHIDILRHIKKTIKIPVIMKLGDNLTNPVALIEIM